MLALLLLRGLLLRRRVGSRRIADMRGAFDLHLADAHRRQTRVQAQPVAVLSQGGFGDVAGDGQADRCAVNALADADVDRAELVAADLEPALRAIGGEARNVARQRIDPLARHAHVDDLRAKRGGEIDRGKRGGDGRDRQRRRGGRGDGGVNGSGHRVRYRGDGCISGCRVAPGRRRRRGLTGHMLTRKLEQRQGFCPGRQ